MNKYILKYNFNSIYSRQLNILTLKCSNSILFEIRLKQTSSRIVLAKFIDGECFTEDTNMRLSIGKNEFVFIEDDFLFLNKINNWIVEEKINIKENDELEIILHETDKNYWE